MALLQISVCLSTLTTLSFGGRKCFGCHCPSTQRGCMSRQTPPSSPPPLLPSFPSRLPIHTPCTDLPAHPSLPRRRSRLPSWNCLACRVHIMRPTHTHRETLPTSLHHSKIIQTLSCLCLCLYVCSVFAHLCQRNVWSKPAAEREVEAAVAAPHRCLLVFTMTVDGPYCVIPAPQSHI